MTLKRGLSTKEINDYLKDDPFFIGCFPSNRLPEISKYPCSLIVNSEKAGHKGLHWYSLFLLKDKCIFFDSFGFPCLEPDILKYLMRQSYKTVSYNKICIQDIMSVSCGLFCISFVKHVHSSESFGKFILNFSTVDLKQNDSIVIDLL